MKQTKLVLYRKWWKGGGFGGWNVSGVNGVFLYAEFYLCFV